MPFGRPMSSDSDHAQQADRDVDMDPSHEQDNDPDHDPEADLFHEGAHTLRNSRRRAGGRAAPARSPAVPAPTAGGACRPAGSSSSCAGPWLTGTALRRPCAAELQV